MSGKTNGHVWEVLCELRFSGSPSLPAGVILPGYLFPLLKTEKLVSTIEALPHAVIPLQMRESDDNLRYLTTHRMVGENGFLAAMGDHAVSVSITRDYEGWLDLRAKAERVFKHALASEALGTIERVSIKYLNLFPSGMGENQFSLINASIRLGSRSLTTEPTQLQYEFKVGNVTALIKIVAQAALQGQTGTKARGTGLILDMDLIVIRPHEGIDDIISSLDEAHQRANEVYQDISGIK